MKTKPRIASLSATALVCCAFSVSGVHGQGDLSMLPLLPSGWLTANPTIVQVGTKPTVTWGIDYPAAVTDYVTVNGASTLVTTEVLDCEIRVLGTAIGIWRKRGGKLELIKPLGCDATYATAEARLSINGGSYSRIFYGNNRDVRPDKVVWSQKDLPKGTTMLFGGRFLLGSGDGNYTGTGVWNNFYTSNSDPVMIRAVASNQPLPFKTKRAGNQASLDAMVMPYIGPNGKMRMGPMDMLISMELTHTDWNLPAHDLQDLILLVTFKTRASHQNNGHGNNLDGIDSSNPGSAPFINLDTDPNVDDEARGS